MSDKTTQGKTAGPAQSADVARTPGRLPRSTSALARTIAVRLMLSWCAVLWERVWRVSWPLFSLIGLFLAFAISGILPTLGGWAHSGLLALFALAAVILAIKALRGLHVPDMLAARRRLERVNNLGDRPLEALSDRPSDPSPQAAALWQEHRRRAAQRIADLRVGLPQPRIAGKDPVALRVVVFVGLAGALLASGSTAPTRLAGAFTPDFTDQKAVAEIAVDAWIAPPDYTRLAPIFLEHQGPQDGEPEDAIIAAPMGSTLTIQVADPPSEPVLIDPDGAEITFTPFGPDAQKLEQEIARDGAYRLNVGQDTIASWTLRAQPDMPPTAALPEAPITTPQLSLRITYSAHDDYGVEAVSARFTRIDGPANDTRRLELDLPAPGPERDGEALKAFRDLTAHPWAGGRVQMVVQARDASGQTGESEALALTLPQRVFQHPVARAIADFRRQLAWDPGANREGVRDGLGALLWQPERFGSDAAVFLSLNAAVRRLDLDRRGLPPGEAAIDALLAQLWETALYLEDGGTSLALDRLRAAERALQEALERDASMAELERLMNDLQQAMNDYMQAMAEQMRDMQEQGQEAPMLNPNDQANTLAPQDLQDMMDQIRDMMRNGMKDAAQQMLSQLQQLMENMRAGVMPQMSPDAREAMDMMKDLQDIMQGQQELMDRTFDQSQRGGTGQSGEGMENMPSENQRGGRNGSGSMNGNTPSPEAALQEALRRQLGDVMRRFGEMMGDIPQSFGQAEGEMRQSTDALNQGQPGQAVDPQGRAVNQLQSAAQSAREAFMERFTQQSGMGQQLPGEGGAETTDPFGRKPSDTYKGAADGQVEIPSGTQMQRSREIRDELRRRAGQRARPDFELEYYDRLLDQFR